MSQGKQGGKPGRPAIEFSEQDREFQRDFFARFLPLASGTPGRGITLATFRRVLGCESNSHVTNLRNGNRRLTAKHYEQLHRQIAELARDAGTDPEKAAQALEVLGLRFGLERTSGPVPQIAVDEELIEEDLGRARGYHDVLMGRQKKSEVGLLSGINEVRHALHAVAYLASQATPGSTPILRIAATAPRSVWRASPAEHLAGEEPREEMHQFCRLIRHAYKAGCTVHFTFRMDVPPLEADPKRGRWSYTLEQLLNMAGSTTGLFKAYNLPEMERIGGTFKKVSTPSSRVVMRPARDVVALKAGDLSVAILMLGDEPWYDPEKVEPGASHLKLRPQCNQGLVLKGMAAEAVFSHARAFRGDEVFEYFGSERGAEFEEAVLAKERAALKYAGELEPGGPEGVTRRMMLYDFPDFARREADHAPGSAWEKHVLGDHPGLSGSRYFAHALERWRVARDHLKRGEVRLIMPVEAIRAVADRDLRDKWRFEGRAFRDPQTGRQRLGELESLLESNPGLNLKLTEGKYTADLYSNRMSFVVLRTGSAEFAVAIERQDPQDSEKAGPVSITAIVSDSPIGSVAADHFDTVWDKDELKHREWARKVISDTLRRMGGPS